VNLFYQPLIPEGVHYLEPEESRHCIKVLRKNSGDSIRITDGKGFFYETVITKADPQKCQFEIRKQESESTRSFSIHIAISPTKNNERTEWFIEKAVEFGIDRITLLLCKNTERTHLKKERLEKVAISAMKQSLKASLPEIIDLVKFNTLVSSAQENERFIAYVDHTNPHHLKNLATTAKNYLVLIGPEGDFSLDELGLAQQSGFQKTSLGQSRLRTETAGLAACHILNLINA
jgi:16S rRNA (uracil1498-N3)-methyltransferase